MFVVMCFSCLFFFKQKTAYEMRISDWSSDVCSSDLKHPDDDRGEQAGKRQTGDRAEFLADDGIDIIGMRLGQLHLHRALAGAGAEQSPRDRKSVVEGQRVSVRVDLGGRRIIKKKKTKILKGSTTKW